MALNHQFEEKVHLFCTESSVMPSNEIFEVALTKVLIVVYGVFYVQLIQFANLFFKIFTFMS